MDGWMEGWMDGWRGGGDGKRRRNARNRQMVEGLRDAGEVS